MKRFIIVTIALIYSITGANMLFAGGTTPDAFTFTDRTNVALSTEYKSNAITVTGIDTAAPISVAGGTYSINGGTYTSASGTVSLGNTVKVRKMSAAAYATTKSATLTIGGVSDTFSVTTMASNIRILPNSDVHVGDEVYFDASLVSDLSDPSTCTYSWNFGDSSMPDNAGRSIVHSYARPGVYTVTLTITEQNNTVHTESGRVTVGGEYRLLAPRPSTDPILYYAFEDNLNDSSINHLNAFWANGTGTYGSGVQYKAANLDSARYVHVADSGHIIGGSSGLTVSFWAKKASTNNIGYLISYPGVFSLQLRENGQWLQGSVTTTNGSASSDAWYPGAQDTNWHHYVLVYDGAYVRIYFDGREQIMEGKCPLPLTGSLPTSGNHLYIGVNDSAGTPFNGMIDEVKIFNKALTKDEITIGFELWHANFHTRIAQYIYVKIPGVITRDAANSLEMTVVGDNGYSATLVNKVNLQPEEKILLQNSSLPAGNYTLQATLRNAAAQVIESISERFAKPYAGIPEVGIDENNAIRVNGELFFPVTPCGLRNFDVEPWAAGKYINMLAIQGFYGMTGPPDYTTAGWEEYLDLGMLYNFKSLGPTSWNGGTSRNSDITIIENYVTLLKSNSGTFGWLWRDEPELGGDNEYLPAEVLQAWTNRTHAIDPLHPVAINLVGNWIASSNPSWWWERSGYYLYLDNARRFGKRSFVADIYAMDYYPVEWAAPHSRGATMDMLTRHLDALRARNYNLVPCTSWVETCDIDEADGAVRHPTPWHPTPAQLKMLIWINVVHGMKGINWFPWHSGTPAANYPVMATFVDQITRLTQVVLGPEINPTVTVTAPGARIDTMVRTYEGKTYLFAVRVSELKITGKTSGSRVTATITVQGVGNATATVFDEDRSLPVTAGSLQDSFAPAEVHIYKIQ